MNRVIALRLTLGAVLASCALRSAGQQLASPGGGVVFNLSLTGGDVNQDGTVDGDDVSAFIAGWKTTGHQGAFARYTHGDLNFDGKTNLTDAGLFRAALGAAHGGAELANMLSRTLVPEPRSAWLILAGMMLLVGVGFRK